MFIFSAAMNDAWALQPMAVTQSFLDPWKDVGRGFRPRRVRAEDKLQRTETRGERERERERDVYDRKRMRYGSIDAREENGHLYFERGIRLEYDPGGRILHRRATALASGTTRFLFIHTVLLRHGYGLIETKDQ